MTLTANQIDILRALARKRSPALGKLSQRMAMDTLVSKGFAVENAYSYRITESGKAALDAVTKKEPQA